MIDVAPDPTLRRDVHAYGWWSETTTSFDTRQELAGTEGTLILNLASDLELVDAKGGRVRLRAGEGFIAGLAQETTLSRSTGKMEGVHLRAPLSTLARIVGVSISDLTDRVIPIADLPGHRTLRLGERLLELQDHEARWSLLDRIVRERLACSPAPCPIIEHIAAGLRAGLRVEALATELGWTRKRLAKTFSQTMGLEPRAFAGLARFEHFAEWIRTDPAVSLADAAMAVGYSDQAHMTREVSRYTGATPGVLRGFVLPEGGGVRE